MLPSREGGERGKLCGLAREREREREDSLKKQMDLTGDVRREGGIGQGERGIEQEREIEMQEDAGIDREEECCTLFAFSFTHMNGD